MSSRKKKSKRYKKKETNYVVTVTGRDGKRITSQKYKTRKQAERHLKNTKQNWRKMYRNARVKKV